jgi:hypothetical protein
MRTPKWRYLVAILREGQSEREMAVIRSSEGYLGRIADFDLFTPMPEAEEKLEITGKILRIALMSGERMARSSAAA